MSRWALPFYKVLMGHCLVQASWLRNECSWYLPRNKTSFILFAPSFLSLIGAFLWSPSAQSPGTTQIYWPHAVFFLIEWAVRTDGCCEGGLVPAHVDKSHHFGKCSRGGLQADKQELWGMLSLSILKGILFLKLSPNDQLVHCPEYPFLRHRYASKSS